MSSGAHQGCKVSGNLVLAGNFRKFSPIVNITDNPETSEDLKETMHATPMSKINHENNVCVTTRVGQKVLSLTYVQKR